MPTEVNGAKLLCINEIADELGVSRQTLWRWRREEKIPAGSKFRDGKILFSEAEVERIRAHACRLEPFPAPDPRQARLFDESSLAG